MQNLHHIMQLNYIGLRLVVVRSKRIYLMLCYFVFEFTMGGLNGEKMASSLQNKNYHI